MTPTWFQDGKMIGPQKSPSLNILTTNVWRISCRPSSKKKGRNFSMDEWRSPILAFNWSHPSWNEIQTDAPSSNRESDPPIKNVLLRCSYRILLRLFNSQSHNYNFFANYELQTMIGQRAKNSLLFPFEWEFFIQMRASYLPLWFDPMHIYLGVWSTSSHSGLHAPQCHI